MSSTTKRQSVAPSSGPKPAVHFSSSLTIPKDASLVGTHSISMQAETIIHPRAKFDSTLGSILVGRRCVVQERAQIGIEPQDKETAGSGGVTFGDYVVVEVLAQIEAGGTDIGEGSIIQVGSRIGSGAKIGKNCTICPRSVIPPGETIPDQTTVFSNGKRRTDRRKIMDVRKINLTKQISVARKMIRHDPEKFQ